LPRIELAALRLLDHAVLQSDRRGAGLQHCLVNHRVLRLRNEAAVVLTDEPVWPNLQGVEARQRIGRRTGDDAVVILRIALGLDQTFEASQRTADPIRVRRPLAKERFHNGFRSLRHEVIGAIRIINQFLGMTESEFTVGFFGLRAVVTGIGARRGVSRFESCQHAGRHERAAPAEISDRQELAIPPRLRHPDFDANVGI
jgi:hypothetical protein